MAIPNTGVFVYACESAGPADEFPDRSIPWLMSLAPFFLLLLQPIRVKPFINRDAVGSSIMTPNATINMVYLTVK